MPEPFTDGTSLLANAQRHALRRKLLAQLLKDYRRAGLNPPFRTGADGAFPGDAEVLEQLTFSIYRLLMNHFDGYLNLMYAADVPEKAFRDLDVTDSVEAARALVLILLRRQWEKVWLRSTYGSRKNGSVS